MSFGVNELLYVLAGGIIILSIVLIYFERRLNRLLKGGKGDLEESFTLHSERLESLEDFRSELEKFLILLERRMRQSIQGVHTTRFNAFKGMSTGGNQSSITTLVNESGDGVILTSLYARDRVSVFSKPIVKWKSELELTPEETESLGEAKKKLLV